MNRQQKISANFEHKIDAALKMLGDVQPPAGLTPRVHRSLETAAVSGPKSSGSPLWIPAISAVAALLLAILLPAHFARRRPASAVQTAELPAINSASAQFQHPTAVPAARSHNQGEAIPAIPRSRAARKPPTYRHAANLMSYPLTRQEKLLLEFAQRARPEDLQDLNPEYQAKVEARQQAEFEAYLKPVSNSTANSGTTESTQNSPE